MAATTGTSARDGRPRNRHPLVWLSAFWAAICFAQWPGTAAAQSDWSVLRNGTIVLLRHANAPGVGDPPNFVLGDCSTQRNLDAQGQEQARRIGEQFRQQRVDVRRVLTSQWCRTRETAELAFPGRAQEAQIFNSFFEDPARRSPQTAEALRLLTQWKGPGVLVVVTHQVNISALTDVVPASGEGVVVRPVQGTLQVTGRLRP